MALVKYQIANLKGLLIESLCFHINPQKNNQVIRTYSVFPMKIATNTNFTTTPSKSTLSSPNQNQLSNTSDLFNKYDIPFLDILVINNLLFF